MRKDFILRTSKSDILRVSALGLENISSSPCVIMVHGFKGFKDWGFVPYTAEFLSNSGFFVLTFNFSHNGVGESLAEFTELDKFAENTFSLEISELSELIDAYKSGFFGEIQNNKIGLIGHSRGGAVALLTAVNITEISAVIVWACVSSFDRYSKRQKQKWREEGVFQVLNTRTNQVMNLNVSLLEDLEKYKDTKLNIESAVRNLNKPLLIIHGEEDLAVPVNEGKLLFSWSDKSKTEFLPVAAAGHTFNIKHPFEGSNPKFDTVLNSSLTFFNKHLK